MDGKFKNIAIPDMFEEHDCTLLSNEQIAELHKEYVLKALNQFNNRKLIAMNTHIVIFNEE